MKKTNILSRLFYKLYILSSPSSPKLFCPNEEDIYLVSYPRSGNTWMRAMLAHILYGDSGTSIKDLQYYIPDIHVKTYLNEVIDTEQHIIKSHYQYYSSPKQCQKKYKRVIYLIRDPRDVVLSFYRYHKKLYDYQWEFNEFVLDWLNGRIWPSSWQEHVNCWTGNSKHELGFDLHCIRYEDLLSDVNHELIKLANFLGINVTKKSVQYAVESASVENMRLKEKQGMRADEIADDFQFIGSASYKQWEEKITAKQVDLIIQYAEEPMKRYGYL
ncbi:sulfotransferase domain-containing protein [Coleofasciculus chthonoplastes]|nr:sulfotransferase domain-containing protein [Coleofasciculus chthonoplastes]